MIETNLFNAKEIEWILSKLSLIKNGDTVEIEIDTKNRDRYFVQTPPYVLLKLPLFDDIKEKFDLTTIILPSFAIEDKNHQAYVAFNPDASISMRSINNFEYLETVLKSLGKYQVSALAVDTNQFNGTRDNVKNKIKSAIHCQNDELISFASKYLENEYSEFLENTQESIKMISCPFGIESVSTDMILYSRRSALPPFDAILLIFLLTDERFRQRHFWKLITIYFDSFINLLEPLNNQEARKYSENAKEKLVRVLLPIVKFELLNNDNFKSILSEARLQEICVNVENFVKTPLLNQEDIYEIIANKLQTNEYNLLEYNAIGSKAKTGHLGEYYHVEIKLITMPDNTEHNLRCFLKLLKGPTEQMNNLLQNGLSQKEDFVYNTLLPLYIDNGLDNLVDVAPQCYLSRPSRLLILDDLGFSGFVAFGPAKLLNYEELKLVISKLLKFHVSSLIFEEIRSREAGRPVRFDDLFSDYLQEILFDSNDNHPLTSMFRSVKKCIFYIIEMQPEIKSRNTKYTSEELYEKIGKIYDSHFSTFGKSNQFRNVITHGDAYMGNILLKYDSNKSVSDAVLIDFQMLRYCPPAYELLFLFYVASSKTSRMKYMNTLLDEYYTTFSKYLTNSGFDSSRVFPKESFLASIEAMRSNAIVAAILYGQFMKLEPEFREDVFQKTELFKYYIEDNMNLLIDIGWKNENYKNQLIELIEDLIDVIV